MARIGSFENRQGGTYGKMPGDVQPSDNNITEDPTQAAADAAAQTAAQAFADTQNQARDYTKVTHTTNPSFVPGT